MGLGHTAFGNGRGDTYQRPQCGRDPEASETPGRHSLCTGELVASMRPRPESLGNAALAAALPEDAACFNAAEAHRPRKPSRRNQRCALPFLLQ